jgi:hypothetical protein
MRNKSKDALVRYSINKNEVEEEEAQSQKKVYALKRGKTLVDKKKTYFGSDHENMSIVSEDIFTSDDNEINKNHFSNKIEPDSKP